MTLFRYSFIWERSGDAFGAIDSHVESGTDPASRTSSRASETVSTSASKSDHCSLRIDLRVFVVSGILVRTRIEISQSCICSARIATDGPIDDAMVAACTEVIRKQV